MLVSVYYKLSLFNAHTMISTFHIFMNVNKKKKKNKNKKNKKKNKNNNNNNQSKEGEQKTNQYCFFAF